MSFDYNSLPKLPDTQETYNQRLAEMRKVIEEGTLDEKVIDLFKSALESEFAPITLLECTYSESEYKLRHEEIDLISLATTSCRKWDFEKIIKYMEAILSNGPDNVTVDQGIAIRDLFQSLHMAFKLGILKLYSEEARKDLNGRIDEITTKYYEIPKDILPGRPDRPQRRFFPKGMS